VAVVPEEKRARALGPLRAKAAPDDQVRGALDVLLLAKILSGAGWQVEYEPEEAGGTPDLRINKDCVEFLVEVRAVVGRLALTLCTSRMTTRERSQASRGEGCRHQVRDLPDLCVPGPTRTDAHRRA